MLATASTPLGRVWQLAYEVVARLVAGRLARHYRAAVVLRGSGAEGRFVPGLSDIDLLVVAPAGVHLPDPPRERRLGGLVQADIYRGDDLAAVAGSTTTTFGLGTFGSAYYGARVPQDPTGLLERPGLPAEVTRWRQLAGPRLHLPPPVADRQATREAAWGDLLTWWRFALEAVVAATPRPTDAYLCVKLVAEPLRALLALDGKEVSGRAEALALGPSVAPELADEIARTRTLLHTLHRSPAAPLAETVPVLVSLSRLLARRIADELPDGETVRLERGSAADELPLADWRALVAEALPGKRLVVCDGDPASVGDLRRLALTQGDDVPAMHSAELLVEPSGSPWFVGRLRVLQARFTDPVSFGLLTGSASAVFPGVRGWSATDWGRRAVAERSAWLDAAGGPQAQPAGWPRPPDVAGTTTEVAALLLASARSALFSLSLSDGEPVLLLDAKDVAAAAGGAAVEVARLLGAGAAPRPGDVEALRETVRALLDRAKQRHVPP